MYIEVTMSFVITITSRTSGVAKELFGTAVRISGPSTRHEFSFV